MAREIPRQYPAWVRSPEETAVQYGVDVDGGLTSKQVEEQRAKYGWNELEKPPGKPLWKLVLEQFDDMLVKVLAAPLQTQTFIIPDGSEASRCLDHEVIFSESGVVASGAPSGCYSVILSGSLRRGQQ